MQIFFFRAGLLQGFGNPEMDHQSNFVILMQAARVSERTLMAAEEIWLSKLK